MLNFRKATVRYSEVWFDEPILGTFDIVTAYQRSTCPGAIKGQSFYTLTIDLTLPQDVIFKAFSAGTRNEIRRAEKSDAFTCDYYFQPRHQLAAFVGFYDVFALGKGLPTARLSHLKRYSDSGHLVLSSVVNEGDVIVWHAYYCTAGRARLLHSASIFRGQDSAQRNLVGRANRYLHWMDIQEFRRRGYRIYDFGGWSPPELADIEKQRINSFKEGFGGVTRTEVNCTYATSVRGAIVLHLRRAKAKLRSAFMR